MSVLKRIAGLFLLVLSAYLFIAFVSYFITWFSWSTDDIISDVSFSRVLFDTELEVHNWTGRLGASLSHLFIKAWFGVSSFYFIVLFFVIGLKGFLSIELFRTRYFFSYGIFLLVWISLFLGFLFPDGKIAILGGIFGFELSQWLNGLIGKPGTLIFLLFALASFLILGFNIHTFIASLFARKQQSDVADSDTGITFEELQNLENESIDSTDEFSSDSELEMDLEIASDEEIGSGEQNESIGELEPELEMSIENEGPEETSENKDEFDVQIAEGDGEVENVEEGKEEKSHGIDTEYDPMEDLKEFAMPGVNFLDDHGSSNEISIN